MILHHHYKKLLVVLLVGFSLLCQLSCGDKSSKPEPAKAAPTVNLYAPSTELTAGTDTAAIAGYILDTSNVGISTLTINGQSVLDQVINPKDTFTIKIAMTSDTLRVYAALISTDARTSVDTLVVTRQKKAPTVTIVSPATDSIFPTGTDTIYVAGTILDASSVGITSLTINGVASTIALNAFATSVPITKDTLQIIALLTAVDTRTSADTITVYRTPSGITTGRAKISGTLLSEGTGRKATKRNRIATNAQGTKKVVHSTVPITGADILIYDANSVSTASSASAVTDTSGNWDVELDPGDYFIFAVYFDKKNLEIITATLPNVEAIEDKETATDSATAISDDIKPMLLTFLDASEPNDKNMFLANEVPKGLPVVLTFSEPMTRQTAGDSITGIVLGTTAPDSGDLPLLDTITVKKFWGPNGKELRLIPTKPLIVGATYKVVISTAVKDLALNKLDGNYSGIFTVMNAADLPEFTIHTTTPSTGDTIPVGFPVEFIFTRPIDIISLNKNYTLTTPDTGINFNGYFEGKGKIARYVNVTPWKHGGTYKIVLDTGTMDLLEEKLDSAYTLSFTIAPKDSFEQIQGTSGEVAGFVNKFMGAYVAGDIETFAQAFHMNFELIENHEGKVDRIQRDIFLKKRREDIEMNNRLTKHGFLSPVYYNLGIFGYNTVTWKLTKNSNSVYFEDVGPNGGAMQVPKVYNMKQIDISDSISFVDRGILYNDDTLIFAPNLDALAFVDEDAREKDPSFFGKLLKEQTNVETQNIMVDMQIKFEIKKLEMKSTDTAQVMMELTDEIKFKDGKFPFPVDTANPPAEIEKHVTAIQMKLIKESGKWITLQMTSKELFSGDIKNFNQDSINQTDFNIDNNIHQTKPIEFVSPTQKAVGVLAPITLEWKAVPDPMVGGYIVAISNEMSGGNQGLLMYTKGTKIILNANGGVDTSLDVSILNADPTSLHVPLPFFNSRLSSFKMEDSSIYVWKVVAVDTSTDESNVGKNQFMIIADSDFGSHHGIGIFTMLPQMPDINNINNNNINQGGDQFSNRDGDMFPDWIEKAFLTNPDDPGSFPDFTVDTDRDGYADFLEHVGSSNPDDENSIPTDIAPKDFIPDTLQTGPDWRPILNKDDDGDHFPNEIEIIFGTDPWNADSKPQQIIKPQVPEGDYVFAIGFGDPQNNDVKKGKLTIYTGDDGKDWVLIDTIEDIEGLEKEGVNLQVELHFNFGEWVSYIGFVDGMNAGKYLKLRFKKMMTPQGAVLQGPVDMADSDMGGGPWIGKFLGSTDKNFDFNKWMGEDINNNNNNNTGELNLGPPPFEAFEYIDSISEFLSLSLNFEQPDVTAKIITILDTLTDSHAFWGPGQWPTLGFKWEEGENRHELHGDMFRTGDKGAGTDSLILHGFYVVEKPGRKRAIEKNHYSFTLIITNYQDERKPTGVWTGWYSKKEDNNKGPLPFIGDSSKVNAALTQTDNMGVIALPNDSFNIAKIDEVKRDGMQEGPWMARVGQDWYWILEAPGDWENVFIEDVQNGTYIVLVPKGGMENDMFVFNGDSVTIRNALNGSNNVITIKGPNPRDVTVNPASLRKHVDPNDTSIIAWLINEPQNDDHFFIFSSQPNNPAQLETINGKPATYERMNEQFIAFEGDSMHIINALVGSLNKVLVEMDGNGLQPVTVNATTLIWFVDQQKPEEKGWIIQDANDAQKQYAFLGRKDNKMALLIDGGKPIVVLVD